MMEATAYTGFFKNYDRFSAERQQNYLYKALNNMFDRYNNKEFHLFQNNNVNPDGIKDDKYKVIHVVDGDTADIVVDGFKIRLRFLDINTPERGKDGYKEAKERLKELILGKYVTLEYHGNGRYNRALVYVYLDGVEINKLMYCEGYAMRYKYSKRTFNCK